MSPTTRGLVLRAAYWTRSRLLWRLYRRLAGEAVRAAREAPQ